MLRGSNRLVFLLNIIIKVLNLFQFQFISDSEYFIDDLSSYVFVIATLF